MTGPDMRWGIDIKYPYYMAEAVEERVIKKLSDDLRLPKYRGNPNPLAGHCYIACEVCRYLLGDEWKPHQMQWEGESHWFLRHERTRGILDPTAEQFVSEPHYNRGKGKGFLTKGLSKRAEKLLSKFWEDGQLNGW